MLRWFWRKNDVPRLVGCTAGEWYSLHRAPQYRGANWDASLAQAVREITAGGGGNGPPARLVDVLTDVWASSVALDLTPVPEPSIAGVCISSGVLLLRRQASDRRGRSHSPR